MATMTRSRQRRHVPSGDRPQPKPASVPAAPQPESVSPEQIRVHAYQIYQNRCRTGAAGDEFADWLKAERECKALSHGEILVRGDQK